MFRPILGVGAPPVSGNRRRHPSERFGRLRLISQTSPAFARGGHHTPRSRLPRVCPIVLLGFAVFAAIGTRPLGRVRPAEAATSPSPGGTIKIGAVLPLSGKFSASGKYFQQGYELATEEVNQGGGLDVGGRRMTVELILLDDGSDPTKSRSLVEQLVTQNKVNALLGGYDTVLVQAQLVVPDQYKIPMVEGGGAASAIFARGNKYLFGTLATIEDLGNNTMEFLKYWIDRGKLPKPLKIALAWENTDHGKDYQAAVLKWAKDQRETFSVLLDQSFDLNASDFTSLLLQVKAANADAFLSDAHLPDFITMHRQYTQAGMYHQFVSYGARGPDQKGREALGPAADHLVAGLWWTPALTSPQSQKFADKWKNR
jgi:branched-chain amino acid transport system substrate-binding protein